MTERCVVTGGAGVIGAELVNRLIARGDSVRVVDLLRRPDSIPDAVDYVQGDLVELGPEAISSFDPTVVFHLAATFERSDEAPEFWRESAHHNVAASAATLEGATNSPRLRRYVFASSYLIYDPGLYLFDEPQVEATELLESCAISPRNVCGAAKLLHEQEIELASHDPQTQFSSISARIYRVYGPSSRDVVSRWVRSGVNDDPIDVFGDQSRFDYVYSADVADGLIRLADTEATGVVNLATGRSRTVREMVDALQTHFPELNIRSNVPAERYEASEASTDRLREITGWSPPTELELGVSELVKHERGNAAAGTISHRVLPPRQLNVLVTSLSAKTHVPRAVRRAFTALNVTGEVWGGDTDARALARTETSDFWHMPRLDQLAVDELIEFCDRAAIGLIIPTRDGELEYFAEHREALRARGTFVPIGSPDSVRLANDKVAFAEALTAVDLPVIPTSIDLASVPTDRTVVKPRFGAGSSDAGIDVSHADARLLTEQIADPVYQPFIEGPEFSVDVYVDSHGTVLGALARERVLVVDGESHITTVVDDEELVDLASRCAKALGVRGHAVVQLIRSETGTYLLECNSRVGGASSAAWLGGLRSVDAMVLEALGETAGPLTSHQRPITMIRSGVDLIDWSEPSSA